MLLSLRLQKQNNGELLAALSRETKVHLAACFGFLNARQGRIKGRNRGKDRAGTDVLNLGEV